MYGSSTPRPPVENTDITQRTFLMDRPSRPANRRSKIEHSEIHLPAAASWNQIVDRFPHENIGVRPSFRGLESKYSADEAVNVRVEETEPPAVREDEDGAAGVG